MIDTTTTLGAGRSRSAFPTLGEATRVWARIALLSFGGPAGQIAVMHRILVEEKRWIGENRFLHALNFCMLLPGPEATQLAIYVGWLLHRAAGGLIAGVLFVLPGIFALMALSWIYVIYGDVGFVEALFFGLKAAVLAIVLQAVVRIGSRALANGTMLTLAAASFVAIFAFDIAFPLIVAAVALIGFFGGRAGWAAFKFSTPKRHSARKSPSMRGPAVPALGEWRRSASPSGSRRQSWCWRSSVSTMSSATSRCSFPAWRW